MVNAEATNDPRKHVDNIAQMLRDIATHLGEDTKRVDEPQAKALFETTREVLKGLITAFEHYRRDAEQAWDPSTESRPSH
jgi:hypothetical protein